MSPIGATEWNLPPLTGLAILWTINPRLRTCERITNLARGGGQQNVAKHPNGNSPPKLGGVARRRFISRAGVVPQENHPVRAFLRWLRSIFLTAQPPLLT